ncbi:MAG: ASKHA domain-containing protein [Oscillospiraceae bacterium]|jgi:uncharacterized 2Fe-2S/4Fe-4S cluster protein (DUF4445 family)|nr:ASKHA domain-containing protein [Oscillospiraceae bacterium]
MPNITFRGEDGGLIHATAPDGLTILEAARAAGALVESPCGGLGKCGKCRVRVGGDWLLACQAPITDGMEIYMPDSGKANRRVSIVAAGESFDYPIDPYVTGKPNALGIALDIGTTTMVAELIELATGRRLARRSVLNPQTAYAQDVLGRVRFASTPEGLDLLRDCFINAFIGLRNGLALDASARLSDIHEVVYSGNAAMLHLAAGVDPSPLGRYPYRVNLTGGTYLPALRLGLADGATIYLPPFVSAFVGADITSGMLATRLAELPGSTLFIDIGTNGEIAFAHGGEVVAASTAAGPAFEGMNIDCGARAAPGAIERVTIQSDGSADITVIGGETATGICGSGLLDAVAELVRSGIVGRSGRFARQGGGIAGPRQREGKPAYFLTDTVFISQGDIRQVQLAKGAIRSGIDALLDALGVEPGRVDQALIAGSFGFHLRESSLLGLGMLPEAFAGKVRFVGNTSQSGAAAFLLNKGFRDRMRGVTSAARAIDLNDLPDFNKRFIDALGF